MIAVSINFYFKIVEQHAVGKLIFGMINPVDEGMFIAVILFIIVGIFGKSLTHITVPYFYIPLQEFFLYNVIGISCIFGIFTIISILRNKSLLYFISSTYEIIILTILTLIFIQYSDSYWRMIYPKLILLLWSIIVAKLTIEVMFAHIVDEEISSFHMNIWVVIIYFSLWSILDALSKNNEKGILYLIVALNLFVAAYFFCKFKRFYFFPYWNGY